MKAENKIHCEELNVNFFDSKKNENNNMFEAMKNSLEKSKKPISIFEEEPIIEPSEDNQTIITYL